MSPTRKWQILGLAVIAFLVAISFKTRGSFDDCILENMKPGLDPAAVTAIRVSCYAKYPQQAPAVAVDPERALTYEELSKVTGTGNVPPYVRGGYNLSDAFVVKFYNGNTNLVVTELDIDITTLVSDQKVVKRYRKSLLDIDPLSTRETNFTFVEGDTPGVLAWSFVAGRGRPVK